MIHNLQAMEIKCETISKRDREEISVQIKNCNHLAKEVDLRTLGLPAEVFKEFKIQRTSKQIVFKGLRYLEYEANRTFHEDSSLSRLESFCNTTTYIEVKQLDLNLQKQVSELFQNIKAYRLIIDDSYSCNNLTKEFFLRKLRVLGCQEPIASKYFSITEENYRAGTFLIFFKVDNLEREKSNDKKEKKKEKEEGMKGDNRRGKEIKQYFKELEDYLLGVDVFFPMEEYLIHKWKIPDSEYLNSLEVLIRNYEPEWKVKARQISLIIQRIEGDADKEKGEGRVYSRKPECSLLIKIAEGNRNQIYELYKIFQNLFSQLDVKFIELDPDLIITTKIENLQETFPDTYENIHLIGRKNLLVINNRIREPTYFAEEIYLNVWKIGPETFPESDWKKLKLQNDDKSLNATLMKNGVIWKQNLIFDCKSHEIIIKCDSNHKKRFIEECKKLLFMFVVEKSECDDFTDPFTIGIFQKFFKQEAEEKFDCKFEIEIVSETKWKLFRFNYTKYEEKVSDFIRDSFKKIKDSLLTFTSTRRPSESRLKEKKIDKNILYSVMKNPRGYFNEKNEPMLGNSAYLIGKEFPKVLLVTKQFECLRLHKQEQKFVYMFDNRVKKDSAFFDILRKNSIDFQSFTTRARVTKNPDRLRKYITPNSEYSRATILFHAGPERVSNTFERNIRDLLDGEEFKHSKMHIMMPEHDPGFIEELFKKFIKQLHDSKVGVKDESMMDPESIPPFIVYFYYQGGSRVKKLFETILRQGFVKIVPEKGLNLDQSDLMKIYCVNYKSLSLVDENGNKFRTSPVVPFLLQNELNTKKKEVKRFIFSLPKLNQAVNESEAQNLSQMSSQNQTVTYHIEIIVCINTRMIFIVTPNCHSSHQTENPFAMLEPQLQGWTPPYIEVKELKDGDKFLQETVHTIEGYFPNLKYTVLSGRKITDGRHGAKIELSEEYYYVTNEADVIKPVRVEWDGSQRKNIIKRDETRSERAFKVEENRYRSWYEMTTHFNLVEDLCRCLEV